MYYCACAELATSGWKSELSTPLRKILATPLRSRNKTKSIYIAYMTQVVSLSCVSVHKFLTNGQLPS